MRKGNHNWTTHPRVDVEYVNRGRVPYPWVRLSQDEYRAIVSADPDARAFYQEMKAVFFKDRTMDVT